MIRKAILGLGMLAMATAGYAQNTVPCGTDAFYKAQKALYPGIAEQEALLKADLDRQLKAGVHSPFAKTTATTEFNWPEDQNTMHIPVVVHIITDYATNITDNDVYGMMDRLNKYYASANPGIPASIIPPFRTWIGNAHLQFHLATKDPKGNPTRGITRTYSPHAAGGDELAKMGAWAPDQYLNIYLENYIGRGTTGGIVLAYATFPTSYTDNPYSQGVISRADQALSGSTFAHEIGHFLSLYHVWNSNNAGPDVGVCGDDEVDDTPPTEGHFTRGCRLYDTLCATGYFKNYDSATYYQMTGIRRALNIAASDSATTTITFEDSTNNYVGQTFTTDTAASYLESISVAVAPGTVKGAVTMKLYNAAGTTLLATASSNSGLAAGSTIRFSFNGYILAANTQYKFEIDTLVGKSKFLLRAANTNPYPGGQLYGGPGANTPIGTSDLAFKVQRFYRIDYPDTVNTQNIMDYSACATEMFTKGQVARMRATLRSEVGFRSNLVSNQNLYLTGVWDTVNDVAVVPTDVAPIADFSVNRNFICANGSSSVQFTNRSWNDTSSVEWTFSNGATAGNSTGNSINNQFTQPGWVTVSLKASSNAGTNTLTRNDLVYAADPNGTNPTDYYQEFNPGPENDRYPIMNYFKTDHKWEIVNNAGFYDKTSMRYANYDYRTPTIENMPGSPLGDYADFFTPAFDLSGFGSMCNLSFYSAGAYRTNKPGQMNDKLLVSYSIDCGASWVAVDSIKKDIGNNRYLNDPFTPSQMGEWKERSLKVAPRSNQTYFRFRYYPGVIDASNAILGDPYSSLGTGNNFYVDRIRVINTPLGVKNGVIVDLGMSIVPNPTSGAASVRLNGGDGSKAEIIVTDVTGKVVYSTNVRRTSATTQVDVPASALSVKGLYLVKVVTDGATETQKLVAY